VPRFWRKAPVQVTFDALSSRRLCAPQSRFVSAAEQFAYGFQAVCGCCAIAGPDATLSEPVNENISYLASSLAGTSCFYLKKGEKKRAAAYIPDKVIAPMRDVRCQETCALPGDVRMLDVDRG